MGTTYGKTAALGLGVVLLVVGAVGACSSDDVAGSVSGTTSTSTTTTTTTTTTGPGGGGGAGGGTGGMGQGGMTTSDCREPIVAGDPSTHMGTTMGVESFTDGDCLDVGGTDQVYLVTPAVTGLLDLTLTSGADLALFVRTACDDSATEIGCIDIQPEGQEETLSVPVTEGSPVYVFVSGFSDMYFGAYTLDISSHAIVCGDGVIDDPETCDPPDGTICDAQCVFSAANACLAAPPATPSNAGDTSTASRFFEGFCVGSYEAREELYAFTPAADGALLTTLQAATDMGFYLRTDCQDTATQVACVERQLAGIDERRAVPLVSGQGLTLFVDGNSSVDDGTYTLLTQFIPSTEVEPNASPAAANAYTSAFVGTILDDLEDDYVAVVVANAPAMITAETVDLGDGTCLETDTALDTLIEIFDVDGVTSLALDDDNGGGFCSLAIAAAPVAGTYFVRVSASDFAFNPRFAYQLNVSVQ